MGSNSMVMVNRGVLVVGAVVLVAVGAGGAWWLIGQQSKQPLPQTAGMTTTDAPASSAPAGEVAITLSTEAAQRVGIELTTVGLSSAAPTLRIPAVVQPNAYKTVSVTPLTNGRVTRVVAEPG